MQILSTKYVFSFIFRTPELHIHPRNILAALDYTYRDDLPLATKDNSSSREVTKFRVVNRNHSVCPSVCLSFCPSICANSCPAHNFFKFDIGLLYLSHGCILMRRFVAYIHDSDTTLNFDLRSNL